MAIMNDNLILLVEDNPSDINLTKRALVKNQLPNALVVVWDGQEALDYLFATGPYSGENCPVIPVLPCLILLDLKLPRLDGFAVLRRVKSDPRTRMIPVVVLTTSTEAVDVRLAYELGANSYIRKPVNFDRFIETIKHLGVYWLTLNESPPVTQ